MTAPLAINFFLFKNGLIWHIRIRSFKAPLTSPASIAAKIEIISLNQIGIFSKPTVTCFTILFNALTIHHIQFMLIMERTYHFMMLPLPINYLFWELLVLTHQVRFFVLTKGHYVVSRPHQLLLNSDVPLRGMTRQGGHSLCLLCLQSVKWVRGTWSKIFANFLHVLVLTSLWLGVPSL